MHEIESVARGAQGDDLFLERLDAFMHKSLGDIRAFADREGKPYEETRRHIAQWHAKYLFQQREGAPQTRAERVHATLYDTSRILESLAEVAGVQSFMLAVDPEETTDIGFLGGSLIGREFWRGMRGGGEPGARAFKQHCAVKAKAHPAQQQQQPPPLPPVAPPTPAKTTPARSVKAELYERVRSALRLASGVRTAEMKWTNTERLDVYGVTLVGWPENVPAQNPSTLKVAQNKLLLESLEKGTMRFERIAGGSAAAKLKEETTAATTTTTTPRAESPEEDFSWAYDADADVGNPSASASVSSSSAAVAAAPPPPPETVVSSARASAAPPEPEPEPEPEPAESIPSMWHDETMGSSFSVDYAWDAGDMNESLLPESLHWSNAEEEDESPVERPRKRQRSEEISKT